MTYENELPLPDYDGGPRDRLRDLALEAAKRIDPNYEYTVQWYSDGSDSWIPEGWKGDNWVTLSQALAGREALQKGFPKDTEYRIVKRRKAGPIEVVDI